MAKKLSSNVELKALEEDIEHTFTCMVEDKNFSSAMQYITPCINKIPSYAVIRTIIFEILMENCSQSVATEAGMYLNDILANHPPSNRDKRLYYKNALMTGKNSNSEWKTIWDVFFHNITSSLIHYKICTCEEEDRSRQVQYPNCDIVIDFYAKVMMENWRFLSTEKAFYEKTEKCLLAELFWPSGSSELYSPAKENPQQFLRFMNDIYIHSARIQKVSVFKKLHQILKLMIKCIITLECDSINENGSIKSMPEALICKSACLLDIVRTATNLCKDAISTHENLRRFVNHITVKAFQLKIVEYRLYELVFSCKPSERNVAPCTLSTIVNSYMFSNPKKRRRPKKDQLKEKLHLQENELELRSSSEGDTRLHKACRYNKFADLYEMLMTASPPDVNARNQDRHTPLHIACISESYHCAKILMEECNRENAQMKLDWTAADTNGLTPLHISVYKNLCDITRMILKRGGSDLLNALDNFGQRPFQYANSKEMDEILREYHLPGIEVENCNMNSICSLDIPHLETFREYALLCHAVHFLLTYYSDIFDLYQVMRLVEEGKGLLRCHEKRACPHFVTCPENTVCSVDLQYLKNLPAIVDHFIKSTTQRTKEKGLSLDLELLPLQFFATCLQSHDT